MPAARDLIEGILSQASPAMQQAVKRYQEPQREHIPKYQDADIRRRLFEQFYQPGDERFTPNRHVRTFARPYDPRESLELSQQFPNLYDFRRPVGNILEAGDLTPYAEERRRPGRGVRTELRLPLQDYLAQRVMNETFFPEIYY